jgi:alpha-glutamyl/putrescinyl thymine pyrophosphorylase clade 1
MDALVETFFSYVKERQLILERRASGQSAPWTEDAILRQYRFCCVRREDDRVTKWMKREVRDKYGNTRSGLQAIVMARWINHPDTLIDLSHNASRNLLIDWNRDEFIEIGSRRQSSKQQLVTGAYMVKTPVGLNKTDGLAQVLEAVLPHCATYAEALLGRSASLSEVHEWLMQFPFIGGFIAYEIVSDLRHTPLLNRANDVMTWCYLGPGAKRGLGWVLEGDPEARFATFRQELACRHLLARANEDAFWIARGGWEMREVEHNLCELDKYVRTLRGLGKPKQKYKGEQNECY